VKKATPQDNFGSFLNKAHLLKLKIKAMRAGVWFRSLERIDRVLYDLMLKVDVTLRSPVLARSILSIKSKLEGFLEGKIVRATREIGLLLASKVSLIAQKWGNVNSKDWINDMGFVRYLAVMDINGRLGR